MSFSIGIQTFIGTTLTESSDLDFIHLLEIILVSNKKTRLVNSCTTTLITCKLFATAIFV